MALSVFNLDDLLADPLTLRIFELIAVRRRLRFEELAKLLGKDVAYQDMSERLKQLVQARLLAVASAPIADFDIYYVTANGLYTDRQLRRRQQIPLYRA